MFENAKNNNNANLNFLQILTRVLKCVESTLQNKLADDVSTKGFHYFILLHTRP